MVLELSVTVIFLTFKDAKYETWEENDGIIARHVMECVEEDE